MIKKTSSLFLSFVILVLCFSPFMVSADNHVEIDCFVESSEVADNEKIETEISLSDSGDYEILVSFAETATRLDKFKLDRKYTASLTEEIVDELYLLNISSGQNLEQLLENIESEPGIKYAQPNYIYRPSDSISSDYLTGLSNDLVIDSPLYFAASTINDPGFSNQWALNNIGQNSGTVGIDINILPAWEISTGLEDIIVAVIDTGVDINHPDIINNIWINPGETADGTDSDGNGFVDDLYGWDFARNIPIGAAGYLSHNHGTHVAGIIAAEQNNGQGISGVAPNIKIMPINFMSYRSSNESKPVGSSKLAIKAIEYAKDNGAHIVNASWGITGYYEQALENAVASSGMLFAAAAGNSGKNSDSASNAQYPAAFELPNMISVAAITNTGSLASFSNYGAKSVHLAAPGASILSLLPQNSYGNMSGTSMAAPHVSGIAALMLSVNADLTPKDIKDILISSVRPMNNMGSTIYSAGIVDASKAVNMSANYGTSTTKHQVIFRDWNNTLLKREYVTYNSSAKAPASPKRTGYTFTGWDTDFSKVVSPLSIKANYKINTYTVQFRDWNGNILKTEKVNYNQGATAPANPKRTGYTFTGWDKTFSKITSNLTVTANYRINTYTVQFKNWDGTVLKTEKVPYNNSATAPANPARAGYVFNGWNSDFKNIKKDTVITAVYRLAKLSTSSNSQLTIDQNNNFIRGITAGTTVNSVYSQFVNPENTIRLLASNGQTINDRNSLLATGMKIQLTDGSDQKNIIIRGDVNGDGQISALDLLQVKQHLMGRSSLQSVYYEAGKIGGQEQLSALDLLQMKRHLLGQIDIR